MGRFLFQLIGTLITLVIIGLVGYFAFNRLFQHIGGIEEEQEKVVNISASTSDLRLEHNVEHNGRFGMYVHSIQKYHNLKGVRCYTVLYFFDDNGNLLKGKQIKDKNGDLCLISELIVPESNYMTDEQSAFIPYDEFGVPDKGTFYFNCQLLVYIMDNSTKIELASSSTSRFHLSY